MTSRNTEQTAFGIRAEGHYLTKFLELHKESIGDAAAPLLSGETIPLPGLAILTSGDSLKGVYLVGAAS